MSRLRSVFFALGLGLALAGCDGKVGALSAEVDDPDFQRAQSLKQRGQSGEALASFLKVIARRGEDFAPASQLEAGLLLMKRNPMYAWYRLTKYVELQPNAPQAEYVRAQIDAAKLETFKVFVGQASQTSDWRELKEEIRDLQKQNAELRAMLAAGGSTAGMIPATQIFPGPRSGAGAAKVDAIVVPAATEPSASASAVVPPPAQIPPPTAAQQPATAPKSVRSGSAPSTVAVVQGDGWWTVATRAYGSGVTNADVEKFKAANPGVTLKPGIQVKVPPR